MDCCEGVLSARQDIRPAASEGGVHAGAGDTICTIRVQSIAGSGLARCLRSWVGIHLLRYCKQPGHLGLGWQGQGGFSQSQSQSQIGEQESEPECALSVRDGEGRGQQQVGWKSCGLRIS